MKFLVGFVVYHTACDPATFGTEVMISFQDLTLKISNLKYLSWLESHVEDTRAGHLHFDRTARSEASFSPFNFEGTDLPLVESLPTNLHIEVLAPDEITDTRPQLEENLYSSTHLAPLSSQSYCTEI